MTKLLVGSGGVDEAAQLTDHFDTEAIAVVMRSWQDNLNHLINQAVDQLFCHGVEMDAIQRRYRPGSPAIDVLLVDHAEVYRVTTGIVWQRPDGVILHPDWHHSHTHRTDDYAFAKMLVRLDEVWSGKFAHLNPKSEALLTSTPDL